jgi:hypothetical protein
MTFFLDLKNMGDNGDGERSDDVNDRALPEGARRQDHFQRHRGWL